MFEINQYALLGIIVIAITILLIVIIIVCTVRYNIKQKYKIINKCIENDVSYKDKCKLYNKKLEDAGITSKKEKKKFLKILEALHK